MTAREFVQALRRSLVQGRGVDHVVNSLKNYKDILGFEARSRVFVWSFRPVGQALTEMPVFYWADLLRFPTGVLSHQHPRRYVKFLFHFWTYQRRLRHLSWSSLSRIYHRPLVLWYTYSLFWWAEYCDVLPELLRDPSRTLIAELFTRYIVKIDAMIDTPHGRRYLFEDLPLLKQNCAGVLGELFSHMSHLENAPARRRKLADMIWTFRQNSLEVSRQAQQQSAMNLSQLLEYKERTAGDLSRTWVDLLCELYPARRAENSRQLFGAIAMAVQVIDDMLDSPVDHRDGVHNIFLQLLKNSPGEFEIAAAHFQRIPYSHLDWVWANEHLPHSCREAVKLIARYTAQACALSERPAMTAELCEILLDWKLLPAP